MTQVHISEGNRTVTVNHDSGDLCYIIEQAQKLWEDTRPPPKPGWAIGFAAPPEASHETD